jgi:hypothetical protein
MIPALWFVGGASCACGMMWFGWWLLFAPIDPVHTVRAPFYGDSL